MCSVWGCWFSADGIIWGGHRNFRSWDLAMKQITGVCLWRWHLVPSPLVLCFLYTVKEPASAMLHCWGDGCSAQCLGLSNQGQSPLEPWDQINPSFFECTWLGVCPSHELSHTKVGNEVPKLLFLEGKWWLKYVSYSGSFALLIFLTMGLFDVGTCIRPRGHLTPVHLHS